MDTKQHGAAMVELMIGLVAILAVFAGLIQMVSLSRARHDTQYAARSQAGEASFRDLGGGIGQISDADYIRDWDSGSDGRRHTRDDSATGGDAFRFSDTILQQSSPDTAGWRIIAQAPGDRLSLLVGQPNPASLFGLIEAEEHETVKLLPAVQSLLYDAESIEVESRVWMTWTKGIY
jgi:hypothetical protein